MSGSEWPDVVTIWWFLVVSFQFLMSKWQIAEKYLQISTHCRSSWVVHSQSDWGGQGHNRPAECVTQNFWPGWKHIGWIVGSLHCCILHCAYSRDEKRTRDEILTMESHKEANFRSQSWGYGLCYNLVSLGLHYSLNLCLGIASGAVATSVLILTHPFCWQPSSGWPRI